MTPKAKSVDTPAPSTPNPGVSMSFPFLPVQTMEFGGQSLSMAAPVPRPAPAPIAAPMRACRPRCPARREDTFCTLERERVWSAPLDRMMMASSVVDWNWPLKDFLLLTTTRTCCPGLSCLRLFHAGFWAPQSEELTSRPRSGSTTRRQNVRTANLLFRTHRSYTDSAAFFRQPDLYLKLLKYPDITH